MQKAKAPSFRNLTSTSAAASKVMAGNRATNTTCEALLCAELRRIGLKFRRNVYSLAGRPDIVFAAHRVAVFCDGDFWHGRRWAVRKKKLSRGSNASYWIAKIETNIARDRHQRAALKRAGWNVVRVWESDILDNPKRAAETLVRSVAAATSESGFAR